jgi:hypothetical protein
MYHEVTRAELRRSCAKLCHASGGELDPIQFLPGHVSVQTGMQCRLLVQVGEATHETYGSKDDEQKVIEKRVDKAKLIGSGLLRDITKR